VSEPSNELGVAYGLAMLKRLLIALGVFAIGIAGWFVFQHFNPQVSIDFTQAELQAKLAQRFPIEKCAPLNLACFVVREPSLALNSGSDRIDVATRFALRVGGREHPGHASFSTKIRYDAQAGAFFLSEVKILEFSTEGRLGELEAIVNTQGEAIIGMLLRTTPVFTLKNDSREQRIAQSIVRDVKVVDGKLRVVLLSKSS
jgi:Protein of unknown function (DUF1439)